jgi:hypothetical protein
MDKRLKVPIVTTALLAAAGALYQLAAPEITRALRASGSAPEDDIVVARHDAALSHCQQAAQMIFDVHWAAACMTEAAQAAPGRAQGHPECDLPDHKAAEVNAWLNQAEAQCAAEAGAGLRP